MVVSIVHLGSVPRHEGSAAMCSFSGPSSLAELQQPAQTVCAAVVALPSVL